MQPFSEHPHSGWKALGRGSWKGLLMAASILHCWMPPRSAQGTPVSIVPRPPYGTVGSNVTLTIEGFSERALSYNWYRKTTENSNRIVSYSTLTGVQKPTDIRERVQPRGFLFIPHLTLGDDDLYVVQIVDSRGVIAAIVRGKLPVYEKLAKPNITVSSTNVGENDSLELTCSTENKGVNILWLSNNQPLALNDKMNMTHDNQTLTIMSVKRTDAGSYQCEAGNPVSTNRSDSQILTVNYGPDHIEILPSPENGEIKVQFNTSLTLECRALSYPSVHYEWQDINGSVHSGSTFMVNPTSWEQKKYTCWARNNMTNSSISKDITIHVVEVKFSEVARNRKILFGMAPILVLISVLIFKWTESIRSCSMSSNARDRLSQIRSCPGQRKVEKKLKKVD
ncbi:carcinoembryonic antigen-related cell adhesion molecule 21-like isoform X1 [Monodelphis domestica]|uniref:carcinoembryonic antigen-related cell adhesion molecule 21-like isoform X1 n=1 Tax=Monodelphis domestica TaxID=13616 RepID=UPI0024E26DCE|nr:carcinoembryonic antigen-related cell adhesion molecule 21-like isoform X1 [Monodelphis domestica]